MAERNIKVIVRDKNASVEGSPVIICGNSDYTITFDFDTDWSLTGVRTARFVYVKDGKVQHEDVVFFADKVEVPVLSDIDYVNVGVFAEDIFTTTPARINCRRSILCGSGELQEPTPDVYNQIMKLFTDIVEQGLLGATEEQAQQIDQNKADIAAHAQLIAQNTEAIAANAESIAQTDFQLADFMAGVKNGTEVAGKAANASKLNGQSPSYYATAASVTNITNGTTTVGNANKLNGQDSSYFAKESEVQKKSTLGQDVQELIDSEVIELGGKAYTPSNNLLTTVLNTETKNSTPSSSNQGTYVGKWVPARSGQVKVTANIKVNGMSSNSGSPSTVYVYAFTAASLHGIDYGTYALGQVASFENAAIGATISLSKSSLKDYAIIASSNKQDAYSSGTGAILVQKGVPVYFILGSYYTSNQGGSYWTTGATNSIKIYADEVK